MSVIQKQLGHRRLSTSMDFYIKYDLMADDGDKDIFDKLYAWQTATTAFAVV